MEGSEKGRAFVRFMNIMFLIRGFSEVIIGYKIHFDKPARGTKANVCLYVGTLGLRWILVDI